MTPTVGINDNASGVIASISAQLDNLNGKVAVVSVQTVNTVTTISNPVQAHALGGRITSGLTWMNEFGAEAISRTLPGVGTLVALPEGSYVHSSTETRGMQHEATLHEQINAAANRRQMFAPTSVQGGDINITFTGPVTMRDERDIKTLAALLGEEIDKQQGRQLRAERRVRSTDMGRFNT